MAEVEALKSPHRNFRKFRSPAAGVDLRRQWRGPMVLVGLAWLPLAWIPLTAAGQPIAEPVDPPPIVAAAGDVDRLAAEEAPRDRRTAELLRQRYRQIQGLAKVEVEVAFGIVTLRGSTLSFQEVERAVEIAENTDGVAAVEDHIRIETDIEERVRPAYNRALERLREIGSYLPLLLLSAVVVAVFALLARLLGAWRGLYRRFSNNAFVQDLTRNVVQTIAFLIGMVIALDILGATTLVGAVLGSVGVVGLAVGFAFRDLAENYISSILLSLKRPFSPGDHIVIDGHEGKVMRLTSRATVLMTLDGNHLRIPNSDVFKGIILNYSRNPKRRFEFDVGVGVEVDLLEAQRLGLEQLRALYGVLTEPAPEALIVELGDSNVVIRFYGWVDQTASSFAKVKAEAIRRVKVCLEGAGMDLPEPIYRVMLRRPGRQDKQSPSIPARRAESAAPTKDDLAAGEAVDRQIAQELAEGQGKGQGKDLLSISAPEE